MGDYSRDSFRETNALINVLGLPAGPVANARHYVGVRFQQGRPLLDAEFNEADDIRRTMQQTLSRFFLGSGAPVESDGFRLRQAAGDNDFTIEPGVFLAEGEVVWNPVPTTYATQPNAGGQHQTPPQPTLPALPVLAPPAAGEGDRFDLVVLDSWVREVPPTEDDRLVDPRVGLETTARLVREWVVRVVTDVAPDGDQVPGGLRAALPGHQLTVLGRIARREGVDAIAFDDLTDLRRTGLTMDQGEGPLRVYSAVGNLQYDAADFVTMCLATSSVYGDLLYADLFLADLFGTPTAVESVTLLDVFQDVKTRAELGADAARRAGFGRTAALDALTQMHGAQVRFYDFLAPLAAVNPARVRTATFLDQLHLLLGERPLMADGLRQALDARHVRDAIDAQLAINAFVAGRATVLPRGRVTITFVAGPPPVPITPPGPHRYAFDVVSEVSLPEQFDVEARVEGAPDWNVAVPAVLDLEPGDTGRVNADVTIPNASPNPSGTLILRIRSQSNPGGIDFSNDEVEITIGDPPAGPVPIVLDLTIPAINPVEDVYDVGRGNPVGLPGRRKLAEIEITNTSDSAVNQAFTVGFAFSEANRFEPIADVAVQIAGGASDRVAFTLEATAASVNGQRADLTVTVTRDDDPTVTRDLTLMLRVDKA